ncbi:MAG: type I restriction enzyme HsdR N-terminal domain-containing protein [Prevotellaceae bacterium]|jgi:hypothetical protein|nr:type I restriction enzyme HsdR N-terminal domain-containing protein [Prevotellaceae bacterium]
MDFIDQIKQLSDRIEKHKENITTEEATKNAFIMPFLQALGYDVFNPLEVVPEFTCDVGTKKGEKIDYAIIKDNQPIILVECKHWGQDLTLHDNQLLRYFHVSPAKFGLLTNGITYRFYTDLETTNKMDEKPFLEINLTDIRDSQVEELKKFHKSYFDVCNILSSASELKYTSELKSVIKSEFETPSPEFVKLLSKQVYDGMITAKVLEQFTALTKKSINSYINELISERLKSALKVNEDENKPQATAGSECLEEKVATTVEELEGYMIVKSIVRQHVDLSRIMYKDTQSYFGVMIDNMRGTFCRLFLNGKAKYITTFDESKKEVRHNIECLDDIFKFSDFILKSLTLQMKE